MQRTFTPKTTVHIQPTTNSALKSTIIQNIENWCQFYKLTDDDITHLSIIENSNIYNFYTSLLYLLYPKYHLLYTFEQKLDMVEELLRFMMTKIATDPIIKGQLQLKRINANPLLIELKSKPIQTANVVMFAALLFDINIIVVPIAPKSAIEVYFNDPEYDNCKPHIICGRDAQQIYHPITYRDQTLLNYFDHPVIKSLLEQNKIIEKN